MYPIKIKEKYNQNNLSNLSYRFSVPYLWNYISWDSREWVWSHLAVDIVPESPNQEVYSPLDWEVFKVWEDGVYWKYIVIKHQNAREPNDFSKTTTLYSCYEHLSDTKVSIWDKLKEWDIIWNTWNTWNSFWEHLHFQIDREEAPYKPYWPFTWNDAKNAWVSFSWWVDIWLWIENAKKYTINPLVYLDNLEKYKNSNSQNIVTQNPKVEEKIAIETEIQTPKIEEKLVVEIPKVEQKIVIETTNNTNYNSSTTTHNDSKQENIINNNILKEEKIEVLKYDNNSNIISDPLLDELKKKDLKI